MQQKITGWVVVLALAVVSLVSVASANAQTSRAIGGLTVPVSGTVNSATNTLTGTLNISRFTIVNGVLTAVGTLTATVLDPNTGGIVQTIIRQVAVPVTATNGTCDILHLELGPLDLTLLGLAVHLDKIVLDITAQAGGGLLGNLLCQISGLLDSGTLTTSLTNLLNQLLGVLAGL